MDKIISVFKLAGRPENILMFSGLVAAFHLGKVTPAIDSLEAEFAMEMSEIAFFMSAVQFSGALFGIFLGVLTDGLGARKCIIGGHTILIGASVLAPYSPDTFHLIATRLIESLGFLLIVLPTPRLIRTVVSNENLPFRLGLWGCYISLGTSAAFLAGPLFIRIGGWSNWWLVAALLSAISIIMIVKCINPSENQANKNGRSGQLGSTFRRCISKVMSNVSTWLVGLTFAIYAGQWLSVIGLLPLLLADYRLSAQNLGLLTAVASISNIVGNIVAALCLKKAVRATSLVLTGFLSMGVFSVIALNSEVLWLTYSAVVLFSMFGGLIPATLFNLAVSTAPGEETVSTAVGLVQQITSIGMVATPPLFAFFFTQSTAISSFFSSFCLFIGMITTLFVAKLLTCQHR